MNPAAAEVGLEGKTDEELEGRSEKRNQPNL